MATKVTDSAKMGHNKTSRIVQKGCPGCGNMAGMIELRYPVRKANGAWGWKVWKTFAHVECLGKV